MGAFGTGVNVGGGAGVYKVVGNYVSTQLSGPYGALAGGAGPSAANLFQMFPFIPDFSFNTDTIAYNVAATVAGALGSFCIFTAKNNAGTPDVVLAKAENLDVGATGNRTSSISCSFIGGYMYWIGFIANNAAVSLYAESAGHRYLPYSSSLVINGVNSITQGHVFGTIPDVWPYDNGTSFKLYAPKVSFRIES